MSNPKTKTQFPENFGLYLDELSELTGSPEFFVKHLCATGPRPKIVFHFFEQLSRCTPAKILNFGEHFLSGWVISSVKGDNREIMQPGIAGVFR